MNDNSKIKLDLYLTLVTQYVKRYSIFDWISSFKKCVNQFNMKTTIDITIVNYNDSKYGNLSTCRSVTVFVPNTILKCG